MFAMKSPTFADVNDTLAIITNDYESSLNLTECVETGTYSCMAHNGVANGTSAQVKVYVTCKYQ